MLGVLVRAGMPAVGDAADLLAVLVTYTVGQVLAEVGEPVGGGETPPDYRALTAGTHPDLAALLSTGWSYDPDAQYDRGLAALLDGWPGA